MKGIANRQKLKVTARIGSQESDAKRRKLEKAMQKMKPKEARVQNVQQSGFFPRRELIVSRGLTTLPHRS